MMFTIKMNKVKDVTSVVLATAAITALILPSSSAFFPLTLRTTMRVTGVESTPNPCSFKFDLDHSSLAHKGSKGITYTSRNSADAPGEIKDLIELEGVDSVYALGDWLCLNKKPSAKWNTIVPAAVEALGGPAESLDPALLMMSASGEDGGSLSIKRSEMDGIDVRLQVSNGIPIQVEACPPGGSPIRRKLSPRFIDAMNEFVRSSGDEMAFFKGRQWLPRGVRYPDDDDRAAAVLVEEALSAAVDEVELAYNESRLRGVVAEAVSAIQRVPGGGAGSGTTREADAAKANSDKKMKEVQEAAAALRSSSNEEVVAAVDRLCDLAEDAIPPPTTSGVERESSTTARDALDALVGFVSSGAGPVAARRSAVSFVGGVGEAAGVAGLEAVAAVFRGDKSPGVRRTAGDALSDLGHPGAVPIAVAGLRDTSKLVRWRAARVIGELGIREDDAVSLDEVREEEVEFEVAFEMSDAARKVRSRVSAAGEMGEEEAGKGAAAAGPVWKQIQERR